MAHGPGQSVLGLVVAMIEHYASLELPYMHILYGVVSVLVIPALYVYIRVDEDSQVMLVYGVGLIFLAFTIWRLIVTG